jgi:uncharacterized protein YndB with AHSA1/START domain
MIYKILGGVVLALVVLVLVALEVIRNDLRVGGTYLWAMKSPKGEMFWNTGVYKEVVPNRRIVSTLSFADETGKAVPGSRAPVPGRWPNAVTVIVEFSESSGKTKVTVTEVGLPLIVKILSRVAWDQQFDKIEGLLSGTTGSLQPATSTFREVAEDTTTVKSLAQVIQRKPAWVTFPRRRPGRLLLPWDYFRFARDPGAIAQLSGEPHLGLTGNHGSLTTASTSPFANLPHGGSIGLSKKCSTNARKNDDDISRYADILASICLLMRPSFCSAAM